MTHPSTPETPTAKRPHGNTGNQHARKHGAYSRIDPAGVRDLTEHAQAILSEVEPDPDALARALRAIATARAAERARRAADHGRQTSAAAEGEGESHA